MISGPVALTLLQRKSSHSTTINQNTKMKTIFCSPKLSKCQQTLHLQVATTVMEQWLSICRLWPTLLIALHPLTILASLRRHLQTPAKMHSLKERSYQHSISLKSHRTDQVQLTELPLKIEKIATHQLLKYKIQCQERFHRSLHLEVLSAPLSRSNLLNSKLMEQASWVMQFSSQSSFKVFSNHLCNRKRTLSQLKSQR